MKIGVIIISHLLKVSERKDPQHTLFCGKTVFLKGFCGAFKSHAACFRRCHFPERLLSESLLLVRFQNYFFRRAVLLMTSATVVVIYYQYGKFEVHITTTISAKNYPL